MRKSVSPEGEEGVTMIAGKAAFSSTRGFERSENWRAQTKIQTGCIQIPAHQEGEG